MLRVHKGHVLFPKKEAGFKTGCGREGMNQPRLIAASPKFSGLNIC